VTHLPVEPQLVGQRNRFPVDPRSSESLLQQIDKQVSIFTFVAANEWGQNGKLGAAG